MKKTYLYIIILFALSVVAYLLLKDQSNSSLNVDETGFAVKNIEEVDQIFMTSKDGRKVLLTKQDDDWLVNRRYIVRPKAMEILLKTINTLKVKFPVPKSAKNEVVKALATRGIKVEVYKGENNLVKTFYVGGPTEDYTGTYMIMEGAQAPYVMTVPLFNGYLTTRFLLNETEWRDRSIFAYRIEDIQSVSVMYPDSVKKGLQIEVVNEDSFLLRTASGKPVDFNASQENMSAYLGFYRFIAAEAFMNDYAKKDSILGNEPFCIITVKDVTGYENTGKLYHKPLDKGTKQQYDEEGNLMPYDTDRYFISLNNGKEFLIVQDFVFQKLLRSLEEFRSLDSELSSSNKIN